MERGEIRPREIIDVRVLREEEFPADPVARFEAVFAALGNSEAKCLTLLCLSKSVMGEGTIHSRFVDFSRGVWKSNRTVQGGYCRQTLVPIGMVAAADALYLGASEYVVGYRLTAAGEKYGLPIAAYLLEQSKSLPHSLGKIFGWTGTTGDTRAVVNRARILEALAVKKTEVREADLVLELGLGGVTVFNNLKILKALGLVAYQAVGSEQTGWASYTHCRGASIDNVGTVGS